MRDADRVGDARRTSASTAIDPRGLTDLGDESIDRRSRVPGRHDRSASARDSLQNEAAAVAGQPADALRRDRRLRRRQPQRLRRPPSIASCSDNSSYYVLAYYPPNRQARRQVPQDRRAREPARAHGPRAPRLRAAEGEGRAKPRQAAAMSSAGAARGAQQPAAGQRPDDAGVRRAVQGHGAERVGAARRRDARPRSEARRQRQASSSSYHRDRREGQGARRQHRRADAEPAGRRRRRASSRPASGC